MMLVLLEVGGCLFTSIGVWMSPLADCALVVLVYGGGGMNALSLLFSSVGRSRFSRRAGLYARYL